MTIPSPSGIRVRDFGGLFHQVIVFGIVAVLMGAGVVGDVDFDQAAHIEEHVDVEDVLIAVAELQVLAKEHDWKLDMQTHATDLQHAAERACYVKRSSKPRYDACRLEMLRSFSYRFLPSQSESPIELTQDKGMARYEDSVWLERGRTESFSIAVTSFALEHLEQWYPRCTCLWFTEACPIFWSKSKRLNDEDDEAYAHLKVGLDTDACFSRARLHWERCGWATDAPVSMIWRQDASTPLANADWFEYPPASASDPFEDSVYAEVRGSEGWRQVHVWTEEQVFRGRPVAEALPPMPSKWVADGLIRSDWYNKGKKTPTCQDWPYMQEDACVAEQAELLLLMDEFSDIWRRAHSPYFDFSTVRQEDRKGGKSSTFHGSHDIEAWVLAVFAGLRGGYYIDLAAFDPLLYSNTLALERDYGWKGLCVEANSVHWPGLALRNCTVVAAVVTDSTGSLVEFDTRKGSDGLAGIVSPDTDNLRKTGPLELKTYRTVAIRKVLEDFGVPKVIHFLSLDIEGAEYLVLKGFPFDTHTVYLIAAERPDICSRTYLRRARFHYLGAPYDNNQDELWIHESTPNFTQIIKEMGRREPLRRQFIGNPAKSESLEELCTDLAEDVLRSFMQINGGRGGLSLSTG